MRTMSACCLTVSLKSRSGMCKYGQNSIVGQSCEEGKWPVRGGVLEKLWITWNRSGGERKSECLGLLQRAGSLFRFCQRVQLCPTSSARVRHRDLTHQGRDYPGLRCSGLDRSLYRDGKRQMTSWEIPPGHRHRHRARGPSTQFG